MNIVDVIEKKRDKQALTKEEINYFIDGFVKGEIKDYQASALLMAIVLNGMSNQETVDLTNAMLYSGDISDLSSIPGLKCDKHSTGGVGDKVSLVLAPLLASANATIAKMSGRGLGHTGGTLDKLEAIPGFRIELSTEEFLETLKKHHLSIIGQSGNIVPADKKLYALRDVTGTVQSIPLIASSIMSKKLASGSDTILLDVKVGKGAFMKDEAQARELAHTMVDIGKSLNKDVKAVITDMNQPLGYAIGNSLEVIEVIDTLHNKGPQDLTEISLKLGAIMLVQVKIVANEEEGYNLLKSKLEDGSAFNKFREMVIAQGGDVSVIDDPSKFVKAKYSSDIKSSKAGYLHEIDALKVGHVALELGAGRHKKEDAIDYAAGIILKHKVNDKIEVGEVIGTLYSDKEIPESLEDLFKESLSITDTKNEDTSLIKEIIT